MFLQPDSGTCRYPTSSPIPPLMELTPPRYRTEFSHLHWWSSYVLPRPLLPILLKYMVTRRFLFMCIVTSKAAHTWAVVSSVRLSEAAYRATYPLIILELTRLPNIFAFLQYASFRQYAFSTTFWNIDFPMILRPFAPSPKCRQGPLTQCTPLQCYPTPGIRILLSVEDFVWLLPLKPTPALLRSLDCATLLRGAWIPPSAITGTRYFFRMREYLLVPQSSTSASTTRTILETIFSLIYSTQRECPPSGRKAIQVLSSSCKFLFSDVRRD